MAKRKKKASKKTKKKTFKNSERKFTNPNHITWLRNHFRRLSMRWPPRNEAMRRARIAPNTYVCNACKGHFRNKDVQADHISPVVPVNRTHHDLTLDELAARLFVPVEEYQVLCVDCHAEKSSFENEQRRANKG